MLIQINTHKTANVKKSIIPILKKTNSNISSWKLHDKYKYVSNGDSSKNHDNYEYTLGIGLNDINYWVGTFFSYNGHGDGIKHMKNDFPSIGYPNFHGSTNEKVLEYYFNSTGSSHWNNFTPWAPRFLSQFDKDMNGGESKDFSDFTGSGYIGDSQMWLDAYKYKLPMIIQYETWYTSVLHISITAKLGLMTTVNTEANWDSYFK